MLPKKPDNLSGLAFLMIHTMFYQVVLASF